MRLLILWGVASTLRAFDLFMGSGGGVVCSKSVLFLVLIYLVSCFLSSVPIRSTNAPGVEGVFTAVTKLAFLNRRHLSIDLIEVSNNHKPRKQHNPIAAQQLQL